MPRERIGTVDRTQLAFHECGHVLAALAGGAEVHHVSLLAREQTPGLKDGRTLGRVALAASPRTPRALAKIRSLSHRRALAISEARIALAGPAGEELHLGTMTGDFSIWIDADCDWRIFHEGHDVFDACELLAFVYKRGTAARVMREYRAVRAFLVEHRDVLARLADALVVRKRLDAKQIADVVGTDLDAAARSHPSATRRAKGVDDAS